MRWLAATVGPLVSKESSVLEIGSLNVNGTPRSVLKCKHWTGLDKVAGKGVDIVSSAAEYLEHKKHAFDLVVACECYEHDPKWWVTDTLAKSALKVNALYVVTAPAIGFPFHDYGGDYYRFTEMAFREVIFENYDIINLRTIEAEHPMENTVVGVARKVK